MDKLNTKRTRFAPGTDLSNTFLDDYVNVIDFKNLQEESDSSDTDTDPDLVHDTLDNVVPDIGEKPSKETLTAAEEPDLAIQFPRLTEVHPPGGIPVHCESELLLRFVWYKRLRSWFLVSGFKFIQAGVVRGYLGLYHERFLHLISFPYMIHPLSNFYWVWELLTCLLVLSSLLYETFELTFNPFVFVDERDTKISFTVSLVLLFDMILMFNVGHKDYCTQTVALDPIIVRRKYLRGRFWFHLLSRFPSDLMMLLFIPFETRKIKTGLTKVRVVGFVIRLLRYEKPHRFIRQFTKSVQITSWGSQIVTHGFIVLYCIHWGACLHWLLPDVVNANFDTPKNNSWITHFDLWDKDPWFQYANACLRSVGNLLTLDGGAFVPRETEEIFCTIILIFVSQSVFAYYVSTFSTMVIEVGKEEDKYREMVGCVEEYLRFRKIPEWLQQKVLAYYDKKYRGRCFPEQQIMDTMSSNIRKDILSHNCKRLIEKVYLFSNVPTVVMINLAQRLRYEVCVPGDILLGPQVHTECMYFIEDGFFRVVSEYGHGLEFLAHGDFFGEIAMLCPDIPQMSTVITTTFAEVYCLDKKNFLQCMETFPEVYDVIMKVATERVKKQLKEYEQRSKQTDRDSRYWERFVEQGKKSVQQFYADADAGATPGHYVPPEALQQMYYQHYFGQQKGPTHMSQFLRTTKYRPPNRMLTHISSRDLSVLTTTSLASTFNAKGAK